MYLWMCVLCVRERVRERERERECVYSKDEVLSLLYTHTHTHTHMHTRTPAHTCICTHEHIFSLSLSPSLPLSLSPSLPLSLSLCLSLSRALSPSLSVSAPIESCLTHLKKNVDAACTETRATRGTSAEATAGARGMYCYEDTYSIMRAGLPAYLAAQAAAQQEREMMRWRTCFTSC
jgi:hypothetical protein